MRDRKKTFETLSLMGLLVVFFAMAVLFAKFRQELACVNNWILGASGEIPKPNTSSKNSSSPTKPKEQDLSKAMNSSPSSSSAKKPAGSSSK
ncbi:MAG: hypothetical protein A2X49_08370 [Lentisphaerae bacterium GWF2_52_8]|nr:MAG: hypothetical protein A2X49_08370 [Lentisphaerae bacterium GWF2_52_8]